VVVDVHGYVGDAIVVVEFIAEVGTKLVALTLRPHALVNVDARGLDLERRIADGAKVK
jgi:hypothetical protein